MVAKMELDKKELKKTEAKEKHLKKISDDAMKAEDDERK